MGEQNQLAERSTNTVRPDLAAATVVDIGLLRQPSRAGDGECQGEAARPRQGRDRADRTAGDVCASRRRNTRRRQQRRGTPSFSSRRFGALTVRRVCVLNQFTIWHYRLFG
jgi:hypothetical protein